VKNTLFFISNPSGKVLELFFLRIGHFIPPLSLELVLHFGRTSDSFFSFLRCCPNAVNPPPKHNLPSLVLFFRLFIASRLAPSFSHSETRPSLCWSRLPLIFVLTLPSLYYVRYSTPPPQLFLSSFQFRFLWRSCPHPPLLPPHIDFYNRFTPPPYDVNTPT